MSEPLKNQRGTIVRDRDGVLIAAGQRICFPVPRMTELRQGAVLRWRRDPRNALSMGFVDVMCDDKQERSARPSQCFRPAKKGARHG
jgi:hypothetical protein